MQISTVLIAYYNSNTSITIASELPSLFCLLFVPYSLQSHFCLQRELWGSGIGYMQVTS